MALLGQVLSLHRLLLLYNPELAPPVSRTTHSSTNILRSSYLIHIFNVAVFHCRCVSSGTLAFWSLKNIQFYLWENWWFYRIDRKGLSNCALDSFWRYRLFGKNTAKSLDYWLWNVMPVFKWDPSTSTAIMWCFPRKLQCLNRYIRE